MVFGSCAHNDFKPAWPNYAATRGKQARHLNAVRSLGTRRYESEFAPSSCRKLIDRTAISSLIAQVVSLSRQTPSCTGRYASTAALAMTWALSLIRIVQVQPPGAFALRITARMVVLVLALQQISVPEPIARMRRFPEMRGLHVEGHQDARPAMLAPAFAHRSMCMTPCHCTGEPAACAAPGVPFKPAHRPCSAGTARE